MTIVFVGIAAALVLLRPTRVTWGFFLLAVGYSVVQFGALNSVLDEPYKSADLPLYGVALTLAVWGGGTFNARFPEDTSDLWGRRYEMSLRIVAPLLGILLYLGNIGRGGPWYDSIWLTYEFGLIATLAITLVLVVYRFSIGGPERVRGQWVVFGSVIGLGALIADAVLHLLKIPDFQGSRLDVILTVAIVAIPISVAYAVLRHRVIDVRFVVNRALVYGVLTSAIVIVFSFIEWLIGKKLESQRLAQFVELAGALAIGFWFSLVHRRVERFFEGIFFRGQRRAAQRLARVTAAIPHAASFETVDEFVTDEPAEAYGLTSAVLFRRTGQGDFERVAAHNWPNAALERLPVSDPLIAYLSAERAPLDLDEIAWRHPELPPDSRRPIVAVPIIVRDRLIGVVLYGGRTSHEAFDPDELRRLQDLATAAAAAYDHLEADALRRELAELRTQLEALHPARS